MYLGVMTHLFKKGLVILVGSIFIALGINLFLIPYKVLDGGIIGIALILNYLWALKPGLMIILFSIPVFIIAWFSYREYFYNSLHGMIVSSFLIDLLGPMVGFIHMRAILQLYYRRNFCWCWHWFDVAF